MACSLRCFLSLACVSQTIITAIGSTEPLQSKVSWSGNKHQFQRQISRGLETSTYLNTATEVLHPQCIYKCRVAIIKCLEEKDPKSRLDMEKDLYGKVKEILDIKVDISGPMALAFLVHVGKCPGKEVYMRSLLGDLFLNGVTYRIRFITTLWNCLKRYSSPKDEIFSDPKGTSGRVHYRQALTKFSSTTGERPLLSLFPQLFPQSIHKSQIGKLFEDTLVAADKTRSSDKMIVIGEMLKTYIRDSMFYREDDVFDSMAFIQHCIMHPPSDFLEKELIYGLHSVFYPIFPKVQRFDYENRHLDFITPLRFTGVWD